jgi:hypothetical protein
MGTRSPIFDIEHLQLFSQASASFLLRRVGYGHVATQPIQNRYPLGYWAKLFPLPGRAKSVALDALERTGLGRVPLRLSAGNLAAVGYKR